MLPATRLRRAGPAANLKIPEPPATRNCILFKFQVALPRCVTVARAAAPTLSGEMP